MVGKLSLKMKNNLKGGSMLSDNNWVDCPLCKAKTRVRIYEDTEANRMPIYCRKCGSESLVNIKNMVVKLSSEPVVNTPSR